MRPKRFSENWLKQFLKIDGQDRFLTDYIAGLSDNTNTPESPHTVELDPVNISTGDVMLHINGAVEDRYVIVDLSVCSAASNTISGSSLNSPGPNDMNVIKDNQYIVGVILPNSLTAIGSYAFYGCGRLASITIPANVNSIGDYAFSGCESLASTAIPASVNDIGDYAFSGCKKLTGITISADITAIGSYVFSGCERLTSVTIPASVSSIGYNAFSWCSSLASITIPATVISIGYNAFYGCERLARVTFAEGSDISPGNFSFLSFPVDLREKYFAPGGGAGTYTRPTAYGTPFGTWTKQQ
jgi:hypothetical protein